LSGGDGRGIEPVWSKIRPSNIHAIALQEHATAVSNGIQVRKIAPIVIELGGEASQPLFIRLAKTIRGNAERILRQDPDIKALLIRRMAQRRNVIDRQGDIPLEEAMTELIRQGTPACSSRPVPITCRTLAMRQMPSGSVSQNWGTTRFAASSACWRPASHGDSSATRGYVLAPRWLNELSDSSG